MIDGQEIKIKQNKKYFFEKLYFKNLSLSP
jgi:hypothetical protein